MALAKRLNCCKPCHGRNTRLPLPGRYREAIHHLDYPEIQAAVDRYIVKADLWARAMDEKCLRISNPAEGLAGDKQKPGAEASGFW